MKEERSPVMFVGKYPEETRYIKIEFSHFMAIENAARAAGVAEHVVGWGMVRLWASCVRESRSVVDAFWVAGAFGPIDSDETKEILRGLDVWGLVTRQPDGKYMVRMPRASNKRVTGSGSVYFLRLGDEGPIKIGFAQDLSRRLSSMRTGTPQEVVLLAAMPGTLADEEALHARFAHLRRKREWFEPGEDLLAFIASIKGGK